MWRTTAVLALLAVGCGSGGDPAPRPPVTATVDLERGAAGPPDAGSRAGHGDDLATATTAAGVFSFTGRVKPADSTVRVSDGVVRLEPSGRFTVATASPERGTKRLRLEATNPGRRPWSLGVSLTRGAPDRVRVPERDDEAPSVALAVVPGGGGRPIVGASPSRAGERVDVVRLAEPGFTATAAVRDRAGGAGRIRLTVEQVRRCGDSERPSVRSFPPAQIGTVSVAPGVPAPVERQLSKRFELDVPDGCTVRGEVLAEGTDAHDRQAVTSHIGFSHP